MTIYFRTPHFLFLLTYLLLLTSLKASPYFFYHKCISYFSSFLKHSPHPLRLSILLCFLMAAFPLCGLCLLEDGLCRSWNVGLCIHSLNIKVVFSQTPLCPDFRWRCWRSPVSVYLNSEGFKSLFFPRLYSEHFQWCSLAGLFWFARWEILSCMFDLVLVSVFCVFLEYLLVGYWTFWVKVIFLYLSIWTCVIYLFGSFYLTILISKSLFLYSMSFLSVLFYGCICILELR